MTNPVNPPRRKTQGAPRKRPPPPKAPATEGGPSKARATPGAGWVWALAVLAAGLLALDFAFPRHGQLGMESMPGFYGLLAIGAAVAAVLGALALRAVLGRREDYYDE